MNRYAFPVKSRRDVWCHSRGSTRVKAKAKAWLQLVAGRHTFRPRDMAPSTLARRRRCLPEDLECLRPRRCCSNTSSASNKGIGVGEAIAVPNALGFPHGRPVTCSMKEVSGIVGWPCALSKAVVVMPTRPCRDLESAPTPRSAHTRRISAMDNWPSKSES